MFLSVHTIIDDCIYSYDKYSESLSVFSPGFTQLLERPQVLYELHWSYSQSLAVEMNSKYFQLFFFIIALIITVINVHNRFFTKRVIEFLKNYRGQR